MSTDRRRPHERRWWKRWFVIFEPRDLWIGVFISPEKYDDVSGDFVQRTYFTLIPTIVLVRQRWAPGLGPRFPGGC